MPFAHIQGNRLYYEDSGGDGPTVLFSHGFLLDHSMWESQVEALRDRYRCITWDERSHGMSEVNGPFTHWDAANDAVGLLDHLGIAKAHFVGLSQGGFLTLRAALLHPQRVQTLVVIDTAAGVDGPEVIAGYRAMQKRWVEEGPIGEVAKINAELIFGEGYDARSWIAKWQGKPPSWHDTAWNTVVGRDDIRGRLKDIRCPALVINGSEDQAFTVEIARDIAGNLGNAKDVVVIEGAFHCPVVTHPEAVNRTLRPFLDAHG
jgi:pimeloyl-ACP methyl ester carboxylesterase